MFNEIDKDFGLTPIAEFDTLFARDKRGKLIVFQCEVFETSSKKGLIITKTGGYGNKLIPKKHNVVSGKNIGKANATTIIEQTVAEATSMWKQKKTDGYKSFKDLESFNLSPKYEGQDAKFWLDRYLPRFNTDHNNRIKPMLAEKWKRANSYPCYIQPKYNGVRCMSLLETNTVVMLSREGTEYDIIHIKPELKKIFNEFPNYILDGELYCHGKPLNEIVSLVRTGGLLGLEIYYVLYDIICDFDDTQVDRITYLKEVKSFIETNFIKDIKIAPTYRCTDKDFISKYHSDNIKAGFEGSILRPYNKTYYSGFRDNALQKIKETISEEFEIIGVSLKPGAPFEDFVWICITTERKQFEVKPHGTVKERKDWYEQYHSFIGKKLQLTFHEYTKDKFPFHITEVIVRDYE